MKNSLTFVALCLICLSFSAGFSCSSATSSDQKKSATNEKDTIAGKQPGGMQPLDTAAYNTKMQTLANSDTTGRWPAKFPLPLPGAIFPFNRDCRFLRKSLFQKNGNIRGNP